MTGHTRGMARDHGWYTSDIKLVFFSVCKRPQLVRISAFDLTQLSSTQLKASVSGYTGAIFHSCLSISEVHIRFRLFIAKVTKWFAGPDPFPGVGNMILEIEIEDSNDSHDNDNGDSDEEMEPAPQPAAPELAIPELPLAPQVGDPSDVVSIDVPTTLDVIKESLESAPTRGMVPASSASKDAAGSPKPGSSSETSRSPSHPGDGWYVVHHAILPGVCYGV